MSSASLLGFASAATLVLLASACAVAGSVYLANRGARQARAETLVLLRNAISPQGRPGLVQRMETVEVNLSIVSRELEQHEELAGSQRLELMQSVEQLRAWVGRELDQLRGIRV